MKTDGSVVTWGDPENGIDSNRVAVDLSGGVRLVVSNSGAFAALRTDGSVHVWGGAWAGDGLLRAGLADAQACGVYTVLACEGAFAAVKLDGSALVWGYPASTAAVALLFDEARVVDYSRSD